jgi:hypothetical protein
MFIQQLFEGEIKRVIAIYPGRFQPFHLGHKEVFETLQAKFGTDNVFIGTSNKTDAVKSPFNFSDKIQLMTAAGVNNHHVIEVSSPYMPDDYIRAIGFNPAETVLIFAVGAPDLKRLEVDAHYTALTPTGRPSKIPDGKSVGDPKPFKTFKSLQDSETADQHQYVLIVNEREKKVTVNGKDFDASHGTQVRALWNEVRNDPKASAQVLQQLYGRATPEIAHIFNKIPDANAVPAPAPAAAPKLKAVKQPLPAKDLSEFAPPGSGDDGDSDYAYLQKLAQRIAAVLPQDTVSARIEDYYDLEDYLDFHPNLLRELDALDNETQGAVVNLVANIFYEKNGSGEEDINEDAAGVGVIANKKQKNDPRYSMSMTKDVRPGALKKNMKKLHLEGNDYEHGFADPNAPRLGNKAGVKRAELQHELGHEQNNLAIAINGKVWKVIPGKGYADSKEEWSYLNNMKNWAAKKSASSGKKWTVHLTGAPITVDESFFGRVKSAIGPWFLKKDGDVLRTVNGQPFTFKSKEEAVKWAMKTYKVSYNQQNIIPTTNPDKNLMTPTGAVVSESASPVTHRIGLTVTDPNHPMVSKRGETYHKTVRVTGDDREKAINGAIAHYRRKGYKVHDHHYIGTVDESQLDELSPKTLGSYAKKAAIDAKFLGHQAGAQQGDAMAHAKRPGDGADAGSDIDDRAHKRLKGVNRAVDKLTGQGMAEGKHFKTAYGWAGGSKPGGGTYKHPDQIKADREAKKKSKEQEQEKNKQPNVTETVLNPQDPKSDYEAKRKALHDLSLDKNVDQKHVQQRRLDLDKEAKAKGVAEGSKYKCSCHSGDPDPDCPVHGLEPMEVGDALDVKKGVAEGAESMTPNWAKYVLDQIYNSDGTVTLTDLFDEGIPGLHDMFMDVAHQHGLDPEEEFEEVQHELTLELEDLIKGGHDIDETGLGLDYKRNRFKSLHVSENAEELNIGDPVIITGQGIEFEGKTGDIDSFGENNRFVVVNLYNHGRHSFHSSDVSYNDYADKEDDLDEDMYQYNREDPYNSEFAPRAGMGRMTLRGWKQQMIKRTAELAQQMSAAGQDIDKSALWDNVHAKLKSMNMDPIAQEIEQAQAELEKIRQRGGVRSRAFNK